MTAPAMQFGIDWRQYNQEIKESEILATIIGKCAKINANVDVIFACPEPSKIEPATRSRVISYASQEVENFLQIAKLKPFILVLVQPTVKELQAINYQCLKRSLQIKLLVLTYDREKNLLTPPEAISFARKELGQAIFEKLDKVDVGPVFEWQPEYEKADKATARPVAFYINCREKETMLSLSKESRRMSLLNLRSIMPS